MPLDYEDVNDIIDLPVEEKIANSLYKFLIINQLFVVDAITDKVFKFIPENQNAFFLDGPGKEYLFIIFYYNIFFNQRRNW